jgi:hypothetical protein
MAELSQEDLRKILGEGYDKVDAQAAVQPEEPAKGLGGPLILVGAQLALTVVSPLFTRGGMVPPSYMLLLFAFETYTVWLLSLFLRHRAAFPAQFLAWVWLGPALSLAAALLDSAPIDGPFLFILLFGAANAVVWTIYMRRSKRVAVTFVMR